MLNWRSLSRRISKLEPPRPAPGRKGTSFSDMRQLFASLEHPDDRTRLLELWSRCLSVGLDDLKDDDLLKLEELFALAEDGKADLSRLTTDELVELRDLYRVGRGEPPHPGYAHAPHRQRWASRDLTN